MPADIERIFGVVLADTCPPYDGRVVAPIWDETLYAGSAGYYAAGRLPYPPELPDVLRRELGLDGTGRLLDVGCGPGSLTLLLARLFAAVVGVEADLRALLRRTSPGGSFPSRPARSRW
jgi:SAM-dependent methyltransferase